MLFLEDDDFLDLHLLKDARRLVQERDLRVAALRAGVEPVVVESLDVRFWKRRALVPGMAGLRADLAFAPLPLLRLGACDVRRRRLAGVGGVFRDLRHLALQILDLSLQQIDLPRQLADDPGRGFRRNLGSDPIFSDNSQMTLAAASGEIWGQTRFFRFFLRAD